MKTPFIWDIGVEFREKDFAKTSNLPKANFWQHFGTPFICWSLNKNPVQTKVRSLSILWQNCWNIIWLTVHRKLPFSGRRMAVFLKVRITFDWSKFLTDSTVPDSSPFFAMFWTREEFLTTLTPLICLFPGYFIFFSEPPKAQFLLILTVALKTFGSNHAY